MKYYSRKLKFPAIVACGVEDPKASGSLLATGRSKAVVLV